MNSIKWCFLEQMPLVSWVACIISACTFWHAVCSCVFVTHCVLCQTSQSCILKQNVRKWIATYWNCGFINDVQFWFACDCRQVFCGWSDARRVKLWFRQAMQKSKAEIVILICAITNFKISIFMKESNCHPITINLPQLPQEFKRRNSVLFT